MIDTVKLKTLYRVCFETNTKAKRALARSIRKINQAIKDNKDHADLTFDDFVLANMIIRTLNPVGIKEFKSYNNGGKWVVVVGGW